MNPESSPGLSRRDAVRHAVIAGLGLAVSDLTASATEPAAVAPETAFVPENDYPFFGYEPPESLT